MQEFRIGPVPAGLNGSGNISIWVQYRSGRKVQPFSALTHLGIKVLRLVGSFDEGGFTSPVTIIFPNLIFTDTIHYQVSHDRLLARVKRLPVLLSPDHLIGRIAGKPLQGAVPVRDYMAFVYNKGWDGAPLDNLKEGSFLFLKFPLHHVKMAGPLFDNNHGLPGYTP